MNFGAGSTIMKGLSPAFQRRELCLYGLVQHLVHLAAWCRRGRTEHSVDVKQTVTTDRAKWHERVGFYLNEYVKGLRK